MENESIPDLYNLKESDVIGEWDVKTISNTTGPSFFKVGENEIIQFHIRENHEIIYDYHPRMTIRETWRIFYSEKDLRHQPTIITSGGKEFSIMEIKRDEMKLIIGTFEFLLSRHLR